MYHTSSRPFQRHEAGLLLQFPARAGQTILARIKFAGRELDHDLADGITILALQHQTDSAVLTGQERNHHHRAGMNEVLPVTRTPVRQTHGVAECMQKGC